MFKKYGLTLEETGMVMGVTRERVRQIEVEGLEKARDDGEIEKIIKALRPDLGKKYYGAD